MDDTEEKLKKGYNFLVDAIEKLKEGEVLASANNWKEGEIRRIQKSIASAEDGRDWIELLF